VLVEATSLIERVADLDREEFGEVRLTATSCSVAIWRM
jgi:hypothetical protein